MGLRYSIAQATKPAQPMRDLLSVWWTNRNHLYRHHQVWISDEVGEVQTNSLQETLNNKDANTGIITSDGCTVIPLE